MKTIVAGLLLVGTVILSQPALCADDAKYKAQMEGIDRVYSACLDKAEGCDIRDA